MPLSDRTRPTWPTARLADVLLGRGLWLQRFGLGLVFVWFGAPKLFPGLSPAEDLVAATVPCCDPSWFVPMLGAVEILIGLCLWIRRLLPIGLVLMTGHMIGAALPLFILPEIAWKAFPVATLEGQYIIKNVVLIAGAMILGGLCCGVDRAAAEQRGSIPARREETTQLRVLPGGAPRVARSRAKAIPPPGERTLCMRVARRVL